MKFDCVVIIDCWGLHSLKQMLEREFESADERDYEFNKCKRFYQDFKDSLHRFEFDNVLHALYAHSDNGDLLNKLEFNYDMADIDSWDRWMYKTHPLSTRNLGDGKINSLTTDRAVPNDIKKLTDGKKILICGRSFGACVHARPVGIFPLINLGYEIFLSTRLVLREGTRQNTPVKHPTDVDEGFLLSDDVVWTRHRELNENNEYQTVPDLYKAVKLHRNRTLITDMVIEYETTNDEYYI